ncbi:MAG TPA: hypothetical protein VFA12_20020 [Stellaceae bacterium]|nr:hypothetical protein [Stellaceae bacterium]
MTDIAIVNRSTVATDALLSAMLPALQIQVTRDLAPWWGVTATLHFVGAGAQPEPTHWPIWVMDRSDQAGDLGYHDTAGGPLPEARVFAADDAKYGAMLSVTLSHELCEMLVDPTTERMVQLGPVGYAVEIADPVEADSDGYAIGGVQVSNFVTPRYFGLPNPSGDARFDHRGLLTAGCPSLRPGGYSLFFENGVWKSTMARLADGSLSGRAIRSIGRSYRRAGRITGSPALVASCAVVS